MSPSTRRSNAERRHPGGSISVVCRPAFWSALPATDEENHVVRGTMSVGELSESIRDQLLKVRAADGFGRKNLITGSLATGCLKAPRIYLSLAGQSTMSYLDAGAMLSEVYDAGGTGDGFLRIEYSDGDIFSILWRTDLHRRDLEGMIGKCGEALKRSPSIFGGLVVQALSKYRLGDYEGAIQDLNPAVTRGPYCLNQLALADERFFFNEDFAPDAKKKVYIFRITTAFSGRSCIIVAPSSMKDVPSWKAGAARFVLQMAIERLHIVQNGCSAKLFYVVEGGWEQSVPMDGWISDWPGSPQPGQVIEYKLLFSKSDKADDR